VRAYYATPAGQKLRDKHNRSRNRQNQSAPLLEEKPAVQEAPIAVEDPPKEVLAYASSAAGLLSGRYVSSEEVLQIWREHRFDAGGWARYSATARGLSPPDT
jgi:hypothetical protein